MNGTKIFAGIGVLALVVVAALLGSYVRVSWGPPNVQAQPTVNASSVPVAPTTAVVTGANVSPEDYKKLIAVDWKELADTTEEYSKTVKKFSDTKNATSKRDKLAGIKLVAQKQIGQLNMVRKHLAGIVPPDECKGFHQHFADAAKDTVDNFNASINLCGTTTAVHSHVALTQTASGANAEFKACQNDDRMKSALQPHFNADVLSDAADKIVAIHDVADVPKAPPVERVVVVNNYPNALPETNAGGIPPGGSLPVGAPSSYFLAMQSSWTRYQHSRNYVQQWCKAVRGSSTPAAFDYFMQNCISDRQRILSIMQQQVPDRGYEETHQFCLQIVSQSITVCQTALQTHNPDDPTFQNFSRFVSNYQDKISKAYTINLGP